MSTHDVLAALDDQQREVALALERPVVVLAGAGTGKTRAITHRIAYAVQTGRYAPTATLAVTFTTRAAGEMKARLARLGATGVQARTIHSAALRQAQYFWPKAYGSELPPVAPSVISLVARAAGGVLGRTTTPLLRDLAGEIGWAKSGNVDPADYAELAERDGRSVSGVAVDQVARIMASYERIKTSEGVIDFDDILLCTAAMLAEHDDIAGQVRAAYRHFVVDEYQDISAIQHRLLTLWVHGRGDLCVVGDPAQAIHSFAGARPEYLLRFRRDWPGAVQLELSTNYRSSPQILAMANELMVYSRGVRLRPSRPAGPVPEIHRYPGDPEETAALASWLISQHAAGVPWRELAVLYRINAQAPALEAALADAGVPYQVRGTERFYERAEIRQALTLIRQSAALDPAQPALEGVRTVLEQGGWTPDAPSGQGRQRERWESLNSLLDLVKTLAADNPELEMWEVAEELAQRAAWQQPPVGEAVTLATMHASKGLEWDSVALIGVREGMVPFVLADSPSAIAEERRLLYVAITRARRNLRISFSAQAGRGRSRFLKPFAEEAISEPPVKRRSGTLQGRVCRVCGTGISTPAERKLGRHTDCESNYDEGLFEELKAWRKQQAQAQSAPAFVVFTDATLTAIAEAAPPDRAALLSISGIGTVKADRYGAAVLEIVARHTGKESS